MRLESLAPMDCNLLVKNYKSIASRLQIRWSDYEKVKNVGKSDSF